MLKSIFSLQSILVQAVFLLIGIGLLWLVFQKTDFPVLTQTFRQADLLPIIWVFMVSIGTHVLKAWRWKLLIETESTTGFWNLLFGLQVGYLVSIAIPRSGEVVKCLAVSKTEEKPIGFVLGTMVADRMVEVGTFILLLISLPVFFSDLFAQLWIELDLYHLWLSYQVALLMGLLIGLVGLTVVIVLVKKLFSDRQKIQQILAGLRTIQKVGSNPLFWCIHIGVWLSYFLTSYLLFFCFEEMRVLLFSDGYLTMLSGTAAKILPLNGGGLGAYHYVIEKLLTLLGTSSHVAISYALLNHGIQLVFQTVVGLIALILLSRRFKKRIEIQA